MTTHETEFFAHSSLPPESLCLQSHCYLCLLSTNPFQPTPVSTTAASSKHQSQLPQNLLWFKRHMNHLLDQMLWSVLVHIRVFEIYMRTSIRATLSVNLQENGGRKSRKLTILHSAPEHSFLSVRPVISCLLKNLACLWWKDQAEEIWNRNREKLCRASV